MHQPLAQIGVTSQGNGTGGGQLGQPTGFGTTNQQKLKSHVQQFMTKMRKDSEIFYKQFIAFCKSHRETERWSEFHEGVGEMLRPYGDLTGEINKMLHSDFQFEIQEGSMHTTLRASEIGTDNTQTTESKKKHSNNHQNSNQQQSQSQKPVVNQKEVVREKFQMVCQVIKQDCPDKMNEFVSALQEKLNGQEDQLRLFIQTCSEIFGEDHQISHKVRTLFQEQMAHDSALESQAAQQQQQQNQLLQEKGQSQQLLSSNLQSEPTKIAKQTKKGRSTKGQNNQPNNSGNTNKDQQGDKNTLTVGNSSNNGQFSSTKASHTPNGINSNQAGASHYKVPSTRGGDIQLDYPHSVSRTGLNGFDGLDIIPSAQQKNIYPGAPKNELNFLYLTDNHMDPMAFMNMLKLLYLYVECIITASEMVEQGSYLLQGFANPEKLIEQLKDLVECRENSRRRATPYFKPLNDLDFNNHERFTHSYVQMPRFYPKFCSNSTPLTKSILNTQIVTVPQGTEHVTFSIMRKNQYEEQLFKSEDEKYEFDHHIQMYRRTIKTMEKIEVCDDPVECRALMQLAIDLKMVVCLYKNGSPEQQEICEILLSNPKKTVSVTLERLRTKLKEIEDAKASQAKKQWHEVAEKNFHRSLDHRSFIFKRHDRKFTLASRFEKEPEFRNKILLKSSAVIKEQPVKPVEVIQVVPSRTAGSALGSALKNVHLEDGLENAHDFETDPVNYFQFLNSFQGTTTIEKCSHATSEHLLHGFDYVKEPRKHILPIMTFIFEDEQICEDTFSLLMHYLLNAQLNASEREKIKKNAQIVLKGLFGFSFTVLEQSDIVANENKIIKVVTDIENKIFEKIYAYLRPISREEDDRQVKEGMNQEPEEEEKDDKQQLGEDQDDNTHENPKINVEDGDNSKGKKRPKSPSRTPGTVSTSKKTLKDHEMDLEDDKKHPKNPHEHGHSDGSLDEMLDEEGSKETIREMAYWNEKIKENAYLPKCESGDMESFYGTKSLYIFIRFFYVLYERLFKAAEIARSFEDNEKTRMLSAEEKDELAKERYSAFKTILVGSLKARDTKYEDYLRSIFGKQAFLLFTIDKTLQSAVKSLQVLSADDLSHKFLALYVTPDEFKPSSVLALQEETTYAKINKIILDSTNKPGAPDHRSFFRFTRVKGSNILYLNYIDSYYKNWDIDQIQQTKDYFKSFTTAIMEGQQNKSSNSEAPVFLSRNKRKNEEKISQKIRQVSQQNNIEFIAYPNTSHLLSSNAGKEDVLLAGKRKSIPLEKLIEVEVTKKIKFDEWYQQRTEGVIHYKQAIQQKKQLDKEKPDETQSPNEVTQTDKNQIQDDQVQTQP